MAYARMVSDHVISPLLPGTALPADIPESPGMRALALRCFIPRHTTVSGLAGLWLREGGHFPDAVDVVGARGLHRTVNPDPLGAVPVRFHSGNASRESSTRIGGIAVAAPERCVVDALRWAPAALSVRAASEAVRDCGVSVEGLTEYFAREDPRGAGYGRLAALWGSLLPHLRAMGGGASTQ